MGTAVLLGMWQPGTGAQAICRGAAAWYAVLHSLFLAPKLNLSHIKLQMACCTTSGAGLVPHPCCMAGSALLVNMSGLHRMPTQAA